MFPNRPTLKSNGVYVVHGHELSSVGQVEQVIWKKRMLKMVTKPALPLRQ
jgi:hypothetical protein